METKCSAPQNSLYQMTWDEARQRLVQRIESQLKPGDTVFGIPKGGSVIAAMLPAGRQAISPETATVLVDDIIDSGKTMKTWSEKYAKPVYAIVDKRSEIDKNLGWIVFPWESGGDASGPEDAVVRILEFIGEDPKRDGLLDTPKRVCKAFKEMTVGYSMDAKTILDRTFDVTYDEMVILRGIRFTSLCEHHMLPFTGEVSLGYLPNKKVVGISKLARLVEMYARRLQVQERMTQEIAHAMMTHIDAAGVGVVVHAHHSCMGCRGVKQPEADMVTSCMLGAMRTKPEARAEFLRLIGQA